MASNETLPGATGLSQPTAVPAPAPALAPALAPPPVTVMVQQSMEVPMEFIRNAEETVRVGGLHLDTYNHEVMMHPNGAQVKYYRDPVRITCQYCHFRVITTVDDSMTAAMICLLITALLFCLPFGICFYLSGNLNSYRHICPNCGKEVGCSY